MKPLHVLCLASLLLACEKTPEPEAAKKPESAPAPTTAPSAASSSAASANAPSDIAYDVPKVWEVMPNTNSMRKATIKVPKQGGDAEDAELTVSSAGGSMDANITRWCGQFGLTEPTKKEQRTANGLGVTVVELKGPYAGMGGQKKDNFMMLGAVIPGANGQLHFFKLTGPEKTVVASKNDFDTFISSFRAK